MHLWVERVPSKWNISDCPSRFKYNLMEELNAQLLYGSTTSRVGMQSSDKEILTKVLSKLLEVLKMMPLPCKSEVKTAL